MKFLKLEDYLPKLNTIYSALSQLVRVGIPYAEVDHIGSSAIQGAISKGDLDVLVRVPKDKFNDALGKIKEFGFSEKAGSHRTDSLCNLESKNYEIDVAIQLIEKGSEFEMFIEFRDRLNAEPLLVEKYNNLKLSCSGLTQEEYRRRGLGVLKHELIFGLPYSNSMGRAEGPFLKNFFD